MRRYPSIELPETLSAALQNSMNVAQLRRLVRLLGKKMPSRKTELEQLIMSEMAGMKLNAIWEQLDTLQQAAVAEAVHGPDGCFRQAQFRAKYRANPEWGSMTEYNRDDPPTYLRFFFYGQKWGSGELRIPDDLRQRLKEFVPAPRQAELDVLEKIPELIERPWELYDWRTKRTTRGVHRIPLEQRHMERAAQHDLHAALRLIDAGKISVSEKTRRASARTVEIVQTSLHGGDFYADTSQWAKVVSDSRLWDGVGSIRAFAWTFIVQAAGLAQLRGKRLQLTRKGKQALSGDPADVLRGAWDRWLDTKLLDELRRIDCIKGQTGKGNRGLIAPSERREAIADALAECPVGRWIGIDEFFRYMRASEHDFEVSQDYFMWSLYIADSHYGNLGYEGFGDWKILQARYALCFLFEYAATLGLIDVAYVPPAGARQDYGNLWGTDELSFLSRYDGLLYIRLTPLGAYCLGTCEDYTPAVLESEQLLRVLPNLDITVLSQSLPAVDQYALELYANRTSDASWHLERERVLEAVESGHSVTELREFLAARGDPQMPATVTRFLEDIEERAQCLRESGEARLIECADPELAALIAGHTRTRRHCLAAGERHLAVPTGSQAAFRRGLHKLGYSVAPGRTPAVRKRTARTISEGTSPEGAAW
ncbi:MAG: hypothetical protein KAY24_12255 [Candidatus Eisenbacteria sp.]|nr:hypothetical protein [Candidatus Eisenbacteria bacterium]